MGGATGSTGKIKLYSCYIQFIYDKYLGFQTETQASEFADTLWNLFFGGSSSTRPFGDAILDG